LPPDLKTFPELGDVVTASGSWSTAKTLTLPRLLIKTSAAFSLIEKGEPPPVYDTPLAEVKNKLGEVVRVEGEVVEKKPTKIRLGDGADTLVVKTNFEALKSERVSVAGLAVKSGEDILLTPYPPDAIRLIKPPAEPAPHFAKKALPYGIAAIPAAVLGTAAYLGKRIKKKRIAEE
jgi:hypothetical protein